MRQSVTITGLGNESFKTAINNIRSIETAFGRQFKEDTLVGWTTSTFQNNDAIDMSNRYFVSRLHAPDAQGEELGPAIDPAEKLKMLASQGLVHTLDNMVDYFELSPSSGR